MACRIIDELDSNFIAKHIPHNIDNNNFDNLEWPHASIVNNEILQELFVKCESNKLFQQAVIQQYNEILLYYYVDDYQRELLAPPCSILYSRPQNLPTIIYPKFTPLLPEELVWQTSEEDMPIRVGMRLNELKISFYDYKTFMNQIPELCEDLDLREADILLNPSNIGVHPILGLRIIDYGLTNDNLLFDI